MTTSELQPTIENVAATFTEDKIGRNEDVISFIKLLSVLEENHSFALDGQWGSGKTFFVKQVIMLIDSSYGSSNSEFKKYYNDILATISKEQKQKAKKNFAIYFDAWENDNDDEPLLSLIYTISEKYGVNVDTTRNITNILFDVASVFVSSPIATALFGGLIGARTPEKIKTLKDTCNSENILTEIKKSKNIKKIIDNFLNSLVESKGSERIVIFIDELDRCKPIYAVKLLERIKHYMTHPKITFVFSTNLSELSCTIKRCYGNDFNGQKYLEKMFSDIYTLPRLTDKQQRKIEKINKFGSPERIVNIFYNKYGCSFRENLKMMRKVNCFIKKHSRKNQGETPEKLFYLALHFYIIPFFICLRIYDNNIYINCIDGDGKDEFMRFFNHESIYMLVKRQFPDLNNDQYAKLLEEFYKKVFSPIKGQNNEHCNLAGMIIPNNAKEIFLKYINR